MSEIDDVPLIEPIPAPEIFVDGYHSWMLANGVVKFVFFSMVHDPVTNQQQRRVVLRMDAALPVVAGIHQATGLLLEQVEQRMTPGAQPPEEGATRGAH